jgi:hypothetical protein
MSYYDTPSLPQPVTFDDPDSLTLAEDVTTLAASFHIA